MNLATPCDCCKEPIEGKQFADCACSGPVCKDCAIGLSIAKHLLNKHGMENLYTSPCPDNGPDGLNLP